MGKKFILTVINIIWNEDSGLHRKIILLSFLSNSMEEKNGLLSLMKCKKLAKNILVPLNKSDKGGIIILILK